MASQIYFNGRVTGVPGSYSEVDASGMSRLGLSAVGIVAVLGEAEGGAPVTEEIHSVSNPGKVGRLFREGDLLEVGPMLFQPSKDPLIQGGAAEVKFCKVNPATASSRTFADDDSNDVLTVTSVDYGLFTTRINLEIAAGTDQGYLVTIVHEDTTEALDNLGGEAVFSLLYTPGTYGADTMVVSLTPVSTGVVASFTLANAGLRSDYVGELTGITGMVDEQLATITAGNAVQIVSTDNSDTTQTLTVYGIVHGTGLPASEALALNGTTVVTGSTVWASVHGFTLSAVAAGTVSVSDTSGPTALYSLTAGGTARGVYVFSDPIEAGLEILTLAADGATTSDLIVIGTDSSPTTAVEKVTLNGATGVPTTARWTSVSALALGYVSASRTLTLTGLLLDSGDTVTVVSSNVADTTQTATLYGLSVAGAAQTEVVELDGTTPVTGVLTWSKLMGVELSASCAGTVTVTSETESITLFELVTTDLAAGFLRIDNVAATGTVSLVADASSTPAPVALVVGVSALGAAQVAKVQMAGTTPVATTESWQEITGLCLGHVPVARTVTLSGTAFSLSTSGYATAQAVVDRVASLDGWTATAVARDASTFQIEDMDARASVTAIGTAVSFMADLARVVAGINAGSAIVTAEVASGGDAPPAYTAAPAYLSGGVEGTTLFAHWQAALDLLKAERVNTIVLLTSDEAVHAAAEAHARYMAGAGRSERDVCAGAASGETLAQLKARTLALNSRHIRLCAQDVDRYNSDLERETFPPYFTAALAAGMQSGAPLGEPLTFKYLDILATSGNDASYTLTDDAEDLIQSGLNMIERVPNKGYRWLRQISTHQIDDNLAYVECSTNHAVNIAVYEFRTRLEAAVGRRGFDGTVTATREIALGVLAELIADGVIVEWRNLSIELTADVMDVDVEMAPSVPVNFVRSHVHVVTATTLRAAA